MACRAIGMLSVCSSKISPIPYRLSVVFIFAVIVIAPEIAAAPPSPTSEYLQAAVNLQGPAPFDLEIDEPSRTQAGRRPPEAVHELVAKVDGVRRMNKVEGEGESVSGCDGLDLVLHIGVPGECRQSGQAVWNFLGSRSAGMEVTPRLTYVANQFIHERFPSRAAKVDLVHQNATQIQNLWKDEHIPWNHLSPMIPRRLVYTGLLGLADSGDFRSVLLDCDGVPCAEGQSDDTEVVDGEKGIGNSCSDHDL
ncbi:uncharacterized protein BXZ73DRAFT_77967 [Epithele typhae]|uniref:uncharacterized protein n=1 Tax=Epithele typhae TaxID=378194 RepID=UPI0020075430|nr:uncharacterized protein BXZ73DRAFT_77967 [Epithele typhae]KAH9930540.1 hypothetical protein BXZ73DRAFT_77967 [Epithele typhae]